MEMLNILENFDLAAMGHNSADYIAVVSEAMKIATVDKDSHVGDPRFVDVPLDRLCDRGYAAGLAERIKSGVKTHVPRLVAAGGADLAPATWSRPDFPGFAGAGQVCLRVTKCIIFM